MRVERRAGSGEVALETTLVVHGVPRASAMGVARELSAAVRAGGDAGAALVGVCGGRAVVGMNEAELGEMLTRADLAGAGPGDEPGDEPGGGVGGGVTKVNTSNLGLLLHRGGWGATTVSATMEIAAAAGLCVFATGGLGGVHRGYGTRLDISSDLAALARFPVAVVASGVKSLLDVEATREALETLGVPVVGYRTDVFPAFYLRESEAGVDGRFDDVRDLAGYVRQELSRTGRGVLVVNPVPQGQSVSAREWAGWLAEAERRAAGTVGRGVTPRVRGGLHEVSGGRTLEGNVALAVNNARLAGGIAGAMRVGGAAVS